MDQGIATRTKGPISVRPKVSRRSVFASSSSWSPLHIASAPARKSERFSINQLVSCLSDDWAPRKISDPHWGLASMYNCTWMARGVLVDGTTWHKPQSWGERTTKLAFKARATGIRTRCWMSFTSLMSHGPKGSVNNDSRLEDFSPQIYCTCSPWKVEKFR